MEKISTEINPDWEIYIKKIFENQKAIFFSYLSWGGWEGGPYLSFWRETNNLLGGASSAEWGVHQDN